jgi:hypothetical protein
VPNQFDVDAHFTRTLSERDGRLFPIRSWLGDQMLAMSNWSIVVDPLHDPAVGYHTVMIGTGAFGVVEQDMDMIVAGIGPTSAIHHPGPEDVQLAAPNATPQPQLGPWLGQVLEGVLNVLDLEENWDGYGGRPVRPAAVRAALDLLKGEMRYRSAPPAVVPTSSGGIQLEWHERGIDFEIEVDPDGGVTMVYEDDERGIDWEGTLAEGRPFLRRAITTLT